MWFTLQEEERLKQHIKYANKITTNSKPVKMFAFAKIKKEIIIGENKYNSKKSSKFGFPPITNIHAELDLFLKLNKSKVKKVDYIFIFGYRKKFLKNTRPCIYCLNLLKSINYKYIYFFEDGIIVKKSKKEFESETNFKDYILI